MIEEELQKIYKLVGNINYIKGTRYPKRNIIYINKVEYRGANIYNFSIESERTYDYYDVKIHERDDEIEKVKCTCKQFEKEKMCKHIAACLIEHKDDIFHVKKEERIFRISHNILKEFYKEPKQSKIRLKKQLNLSVEVEFIDTYYSTNVYFKLKLGDDKLYSLNNKLIPFLNGYEERIETIKFGKDFTYDPEKHFLIKEDEKIIEYLIELHDKNSYYNFQNLCFQVSQVSSFFDLLKNKPFTIKGYGLIQKVVKENPTFMFLTKEEEYYKLNISKKDITFLGKEYRYAIKENILYELPLKAREILLLMQQNKIEELLFPKEDLELFNKSILPIVKENIILDDTVKEEIILGVKPNIRIYLDIKDGIILCNIKLEYQKETIDYFDVTPAILREDAIEEEVIKDILKYGFQIENNKIYMEEIEKVGEFLEENLIELAQKYEVFTSEKIKETTILKNTSIHSSFSIGKENIMKYEFDLGEIGNKEIISVLESVRQKKKYYRLKNGDMINLNENKELKELESLIEDLDLTEKDLQKGSGILPKYRAIYLDSIKKEKYGIIKTNNLFDELIHNFNSYKDSPILLSAKEEKILRDYQKVGVKWLYNIYKCGFGGILADEMGLGKSIQFIYFIKQVLKEKKEAKILIVAPTSLIYNWKNEFDKFGPEIAYKVFAENKNRRKKELEEAKNVNVFITTYGLMRQDKEVYENIEFEIIMIDEAQNIKNTSSQMTKVVKELHANTKFALTGTPLENSVLELWSIFDFIMPGYLIGKMSFQKKYNIKEVEEENLRVLENLNKKIQPFILRRKKADVIKDLPDKIENNIYIDLNDAQKRLYVAELEKTREEMDAILKEEGYQKGSFKILQLLTKLRQLCIDPRIVYEDYKGGSAKIENLISLVEGIIKNGHKILLFTSYKTALDIVKKEFAKHNISAYVIEGSVSSKKRMELVEKFNKDDTNVFLITLKAGGTGLNLTSADVVIHLDLWWNPQAENQATDRAHRIGQKNIVEVIKLICKGTIEERILELQKKKKILSDTLIEGDTKDQNMISKLTEKDMKRLLALENEEE